MELNENLENKDELKQQRENLKKRADMLNIKYANNVSNEKLASMIADALEGKKPSEDSTSDTKSKTERKLNSRERIRREATKLVRVRVTCHNPDKQQLEGEIFTVANGFIGTISRYVPFGEKTSNGYHIEKCIYNHMKNRTYIHKDSREDPVTKKIKMTTRDAKEFTLEVLPPLTKEELQALRNDQRLRGAIDN